jgi:sulfide:quinone oxidoreductase
MPKITYITPSLAVTGALEPADFAKAAEMGFKAIVSNLPDGESTRHPSSAAEAELAAGAGLAFRHVPATKHDVLGDRVVDATGRALSELEGPILVHCASGLRSALAWAAAAARSQPADCVLATLKAAGFDLASIRDELEQQRGRPHAPSIPPALDCRCGERAPQAEPALP